MVRLQSEPCPDCLFLVGWVLQAWIGNKSAWESNSDTGRRPRCSATIATSRNATFENWQSEFLQLLWQVVGLAYFLYVGSPSSKENDDRMEVKMDAVLRAVGGEQADSLIKQIDREFERDTGHTPHAHGSELAMNAGKGLREK